MRRLFVIALFLTLPPGMVVMAQPAASSKIDLLLEAGYAAHDIKPNPPAGDEVFLRRIYLDVIGRIPTIEEAREFLESSKPEKRSTLIDELLNSEGAVGHSFNYWADILRVSELIGNNRLTTYAYTFWLKDALRENMPYDEFVREMITARGFIWENGASGYYHRDRGMPLDNMSNTIRIFLGTRLECAQCHDHPFDRWTQMDYYEMAAFSYAMDARLYAPEGRKAVAAFQQEFYAEAKEKAPEGRIKPGSPDYLRYRAINQANADLFAFMKFILTRETPDDLKLPHDYQYSDAKPEDVVAPATMFGGDIKADSVENLVDAYADWMTSPENPRFARVIANRLWKRAMGRGLAEPVDEFMDSTAVSNPELLDYLTERMKELDFDMRALQGEIYNTRAYQREMWTEDVPYGVPFHFPGPVLRRLSAGQLWDSMVTLAIPNPDFFMPQINIRLGQVDRLRQIHTSLTSRNEEEIVEMVSDFAEHYTDNYMKVQDLMAAHKKAMADGEDEEAIRLGKELNAIRGKERNYIHNMAHGDRVNGGDARSIYKNFGIGTEKLPLNKIAKTQPRPKSRPGTDQEFNKWREASKGFMRTSELPFPAPRGHFLREFGQSDREAIENSSNSASVPQALSLLNGPFAEALSNPNSVLQLSLAGAESLDEKLNTLFLAVLSRKPTGAERALFSSELEKNGGRAFETILWVLLNSQQFRFLN